MGKESKLKSSGSRYAYPNGDRKLYDPDVCPQGCDEDVWSLALYFEQLAEDNGWSTEARPILYTVLYGRLEKSFPQALDRSPSPVVASSTKGEGGIGENRQAIYPTTIVQDMIDYYYSTYSSNRLPSINDFCNIDYFVSIYRYTIAIYRLKNVVRGSKRLIPTPEPLAPARKSPLDKTPLTCYDGSLTADTPALDARLEDFRREYDESRLRDC